MFSQCFYVSVSLCVTHANQIIIFHGIYRILFVLLCVRLIFVHTSTKIFVVTISGCLQCESVVFVVLPLDCGSIIMLGSGCRQSEISRLLVRNRWDYVTAAPKFQWAFHIPVNTTLDLVTRICHDNGNEWACWRTTHSQKHTDQPEISNSVQGFQKQILIAKTFVVIESIRHTLS